MTQNEASAGGAPTRIMIADDHPVVREGLLNSTGGALSLSA